MINIFFFNNGKYFTLPRPGSWVSPEVLIKNSMRIPNSGGGVLGG